MHSTMSELPSIRVGHADADFIGKDNRILQAAVDYVAGLGGGTVEIGEGVYEMRDSLPIKSASACPTRNQWSNDPGFEIHLKTWRNLRLFRKIGIDHL